MVITVEKIKIGWAEENITPTRKIRLMGEFFERVTSFVETPISVTAFAVERGGDCAVFCSCDLVEIYDILVNDVRARLTSAGAAGLGLDVNKVILNAIHTHNSFTYIDENASTLSVLKAFMPKEEAGYKPLVDTAAEDIMSAEESEDFLAGRITSAVLRAWSDRRGGYLANMFGRVPISFCRRSVYSDGHALMWGDTDTPTFAGLEGGTDSGMELLYSFDENKKLRGVVANVACPAQILEQRSIISSDYWGKAKALLRERFGNDIYLLALCGAAGDLCPRDLIRYVEPETPISDPNISRDHPTHRHADPSMFDISGCNKAARRVFNEISAVYDEIDFDSLYDDAVFTHDAEILPLPLRRVTDSEYREAKNAIDTFAATARGFDYRSNAALHVYAGTLIRYEAQKKQEIYPAEAHFIRLGNIAFATYPFELFLNYGEKIRARSPAEQTFIVELCGGSGGYLPTETAERGGHYSAYVSSGNVGHEGGDLLVRLTLDSFGKMWRN